MRQYVVSMLYCSIGCACLNLAKVRVTTPFLWWKESVKFLDIFMIKEPDTNDLDS